MESDLIALEQKYAYSFTCHWEKNGSLLKNWYLLYLSKYTYFFETRLFENFVFEHTGKGQSFPYLR